MSTIMSIRFTRYLLRTQKVDILPCSISLAAELSRRCWHLC